MSLHYDDDESNPFADPSVRQHTQISNTSGSYNYGSSTGTARNTTAAPSQPTTQPMQPPAYQQGPARLNNDDLLRRQEELDRKAAELQRKEQELKNQAAAQSGVRDNNFPPLPSIIPIKPCFYQDFDVDIPAEFRKTVQLIYYVWLVYVAALLYNFICGIALFAAPDNGDSNFKSIFMPIVYLALFTPCSYACWFRAAYNAFRADSSFNFFLFFFTFFFQFCVAVLFAIGYNANETGFLGWLALINAFDYSIFVGILILISAVLFTLLAVAMAFLLQRVHALYRTTDASFSKAQDEFSKGVMSNQTVQRATATAAQSAAKNAFSGNPA